MVLPAACVPTAGVAAAKVGGGMSLFKIWASIVACMKGSTSYCAHHSNCCAPCCGAAGSGATTCSSCLSGTCDFCAGVGDVVYVSLFTVVDMKTAAMAVAQLQPEDLLIEQQKDIQRHSNLVLQCVVEMDIV